MHCRLGVEHVRFDVSTENAVVFQEARPSFNFLTPQKSARVRVLRRTTTNSLLRKAASRKCTTFWPFWTTPGKPRDYCRGQHISCFVAN